MKILRISFFFATLLTFSSLILATSPFEEESTSKSSRQVSECSVSQAWGIEEKLMEEAFETSPDLVCLMEFGGSFKRLNAKWKEVLGWGIEELLKISYYELIHPDDREKTRIYEQNLIPTGFVNRYLGKDGAYRWLSWISLSNLNKKEVCPCFASAVDITINEIFKQDRQKQIIILNEHVNFQTRVIKAIAEIQKLYLGELGRYDEEKSSPFSVQYIIRHFVHLSKSQFGFIRQIVSQEGRDSLGLTAWEPNSYLSEEGTKLFKDCKQEAKGSFYFDTLLESVLTQKKPIFINDLQSYFSETAFSKDASYFNSLLGVPLTSRNSLVGILVLVNREAGYNEQLLEWFEPLFLLTGRIINEVTLLRFQQEVKKQLIEKEKAEAKSEAKSTFLAHMSHELRTPLSGLIGLLDLINLEKPNKEDLNYLQMAKTTSTSLLDILNDILDLSKIEQHKLALEMIAFNPVKLTQEVIKLLSFSAEKKNLALKLIIDSRIPDVLLGDPLRIRQIIMNLVGNAIKFTEKGAVKVSLNGKISDERDESGEKSPYFLSVTIKDSGIGMAPDTLNKLFLPFSQAEESMSRRFGGTGLGLYITKCLCELMGGSIKVVSKEGKGSTFHFKIRLLFPEKIYVASSETYPEVPDLLPPLQILVAEDNPVNQLLIKVMLERSGCSVTLAQNGLETIKALEKERYDLILMDGQMPEMDGLEATRQIRKLHQFSELPIIGLTAHAMITDRQRFLEAGMNGYLTKPVNKRALHAEIIRCLQERQKMREIIPEAGI